MRAFISYIREKESFKGHNSKEVLIGVSIQISDFDFRKLVRWFEEKGTYVHHSRGRYEKSFHEYWGIGEGSGFISCKENRPYRVVIASRGSDRESATENLKCLTGKSGLPFDEEKIGFFKRDFFHQNF